MEKLMKTPKLLLIVSFLMAFAPIGITCFGQVRVWEEELTLPTWLIDSPEVNPTFAWSSTRQEVYPYPYKETLTNKKSEATYRACWLENEYIKVLILPDIGGRLHGAQDKTNGYNFFYWQPTIKPALVGMTGAWISGGIEWNFPHGHRPTGFSRVQYRLVENSDGSKTVWVGEPELVHRMRWIVGLTVYPGKSVIEAKVRLMNSSPLRHSFQMWATTAVNANDDYQAVFPTRVMTGHGKHEYFHWPVDKGVDISWWKNVPNAASFFAVEPGEFFGGYDNGKKAGTVITGDQNIVNGKKFWTWGTSPSGRIWETILTEGEGPYLEPQAGAYSDNQPDYHWIEPGEIKVYSHYFFPVRDIGPFKMANTNGALNLEVKGSMIHVGAYTTRPLRSAKVVLKLGSETLLSQAVDIDPGRAFVEELEVPAAANSIEDLRLTLLSADGAELIGYSPEILDPVELPEPAKIYADPGEISSLDELWHAGDITYKFRDPKGGREYFEEALRRDSGDSRSNVSLAELEIKKARYQSALEHLSKAFERDPDNGRIFYLRGIAQEGLGDYTSAYQSYYRSAHFEDQLSRAYGRLALLALRSGNAPRAVGHVTKAIDQNLLNPRLWALKATALRKAGSIDEALKTATHALDLDPVSAWAAQEQLLALKAKGEATGDADDLVVHLLHNSQTAIEASLNYANAGLYADAFELLDSVPGGPLTYYFKGFFKDRAGDKSAAAEWFRKGREQSPLNAFAFRLEGIDAFNAALRHEPNDGKAHYYLGLIYGKISDVEKAIEHWERATQLDPDNALAWRDLGLACVSVNEDPEKGLEYYEQAFKVASDDSRILLELDRVKARLGVSSEERLAFLNQHLETVETRDALLGNLVDLLLEEKSFGVAARYLANHHFNSWEGNYSIHNAYMEAYIGLARESKDPREALKYYQQACEYPMNLEVAPREPNLRGFLYYPMALLHKQLGDETEATRLLNITAGEASETPTLGTYYQALALMELGQANEAKGLLQSLDEEAELLIAANSEHFRRMDDDDQKALGHFYRSIYWKAVNQPEKAGKELKLAEALDPAIEREAVIIAQRTYARAHQ
jgi:tetratricopeptide (TPR) repeat protein